MRHADHGLLPFERTAKRIQAHLQELLVVLDLPSVLDHRLEPGLQAVGTRLPSPRCEFVPLRRPLLHAGDEALLHVVVKRGEQFVVGGEVDLPAMETRPDQLPGHSLVLLDELSGQEVDGAVVTQEDAVTRREQPVDRFGEVTRGEIPGRLPVHTFELVDGIRPDVEGTTGRLL